MLSFLFGCITNVINFIINSVISAFKDFSLSLFFELNQY